MSATNDKNDWILESLGTIINQLSDACNQLKHVFFQISNSLSEYIPIFIEFGTWTVAANKLIENNIVFTDTLSMELASEISQSNNIDTIIEKYYFDNKQFRVNRVISRCENSKLIRNYKDLFEQIVATFQRGHYHLACIGLFSIIDGGMSLLSGDITTNFKRRIIQIQNNICKKVELDDVDKKVFLIFMALNSFDCSAFSNSNFSETEPNSINRHWDVHGRSRRPHSRLDFLKVLLWLDALIYIDNLQQKNEDSISEGALE